MTKSHSFPISNPQPVVRSISSDRRCWEGGQASINTLPQSSPPSSWPSSSQSSTSLLVRFPNPHPARTSVLKQFLRSWSRIPVAESPRTHIFCCHRHRQLSSWWHLLCGRSLVACFAFTTSNSARPVLPIDRLPLISERISFFFLPGRKSVEHKPALSPYRLLSFPSLSTAASMTSPKSKQSPKLKQDNFHVFCMRQIQY